MEEEKKILTPVKAIRAKCLDCSNGQYNEVKLCPCTDCPLYPYRLGHNPNRKGKKRLPENTLLADEFSEYMNAPEEEPTESSGEI